MNYVMYGNPAYGVSSIGFSRKAIRPMIYSMTSQLSSSTSITRRFVDISNFFFNDYFYIITGHGNDNKSNLKQCMKNQDNSNSLIISRLVSTTKQQEESIDKILICQESSVDKMTGSIMNQGFLQKEPLYLYMYYNPQ